MTRFLLRRAVATLPVLFGILTVTFLLFRIIPGDPCTAIYGERANEQICAAFAERYGLNQPLVGQYVTYIGQVLSGDLGDSIRYTRSVTDMLIERLPVTIELALMALLFAVVIGVPLGILSAYRRNTPIDLGTMLGANLGVSMPVFWLGLMLAYIFSVVLKDTFLALPPSGRLPAGYQVVPFYVSWGWAADADAAGGLLTFLARFNLLNGVLTLNFDLIGAALRHLILPAIAVGTIPLAIIARMTRSAVLEVLSMDYVRTARAKGLRERMVVNKHAVRNALLPVVTVIGLNFGSLAAGAVLTETIFGLTGVGRTLYDGITARDYPLVQGFTLFIAVIFVVVNLIVDMLYGYLDPRIRMK